MIETKKVIVITDPLDAAGFRMAGVETRGAGNTDVALQLLQHEMEREDVGIVAISETFLAAIDPGILQKWESQTVPFLIRLPSAGRHDRPEERMAQMAEMIRRIIGWRITFSRDRS